MALSRQKQIADGETPHYVSQRKQRGRAEAKLQPPLTPMIDVTFQLLLYFLLTINYRPSEGQIPGSLPLEVGVAVKIKIPLKPIRIVLQPRGPNRESVQYEVDNLPPTDNANELYLSLMGRQKAIGSDEAPVVIRARGDVRWKFVVEVFNAAVRAKFKNIGFATAG